MKKENVFLMIIMAVSCFMFAGTVFAADTNTNLCPAKTLSELRQIASNIKVTYAPGTVVEKLEDPDVETGAMSYTATYIYIKVYNLNSRVYIEATNDSGFEKIARITDAGPDGTITFRQDAINQKIKYTFNIKTSEYGCETKTLRTIRLTLPIYNAYSQLDICAEIPDYYLCQEFVTTPVDGSTFYDKVDAYKAKLVEQGNKVDADNTGTMNKVFAGASKYKYLIVGIIVALGVVLTVVIIKRKENA